MARHPKRPKDSAALAKLVVDIASGWWEGEPIAGRSQTATKEGIDGIRQRLPFGMREIHPDNDTGMINDLLWRYCQQARIRMSRSRPYKKNDNAWVEQRNWTHVRKVVGYERMDTTGELRILRELYADLTVYKNFFQPVMKLREQVRVGGKIHRKYDEPKTPYRRLVESGQIPETAQKRLQTQYESLNAATLWRRIEQSRERLFQCLEAKSKGAPASARRHGPAMRMGRAAHAAGRREMYGERPYGKMPFAFEVQGLRSSGASPKKGII